MNCTTSSPRYSSSSSSTCILLYIVKTFHEGIHNVKPQNVENFTSPPSPQVQQMQVGFQTLGRGSQTRSWGRLTSPPTYHTRSDSAPIRSPSPTSSSPENSLPPLSEVSPEPAILRKTNKPSERGLDGYRPHVYSPDLGRSSYHSGSKFHDPLAEYHHSTTGPDTPRDTSDHRLSVAW